MIFKPWGYQRTAISHLLKHPFSACFLDMGLGKTVSTLTAVNLMQERLAIGQTLVLAPRRVARMVWPKEAKKWDHLQHMRVVSVKGVGFEAMDALKEPADIHCVTYETIPWLFGKYLPTQGKTLPWSMLVADESTKLKKGSTERFKILKPWLDHFERRTILTGTPMPKSYEDLWAQMYIVDRGDRLSPHVTHFRDRWMERYGKKSEWFKKRMKHGADAEINRRIADITLAMKAEDWLEMPKLNHVMHEVELPDKARGIYDELERTMFARMDDVDILACNAAVLSGKCRQASSGFLYDDDKVSHHLHDEKLDVLEDIIDGTGDQILVCYEFEAELAALRKRWPDALVLGAGTSDRQADKIMAAWDAKTAGVVFCNPASVGHGLNFQYGGHTLAWLTVPWSLELYQQMIGRIYRQGQTQPIMIHTIQAKATVDLAVARANRRKANTQDDMMKTLKEYRQEVLARV